MASRTGRKTSEFNVQIPDVESRRVPQRGQRVILLVAIISIMTVLAFLVLIISVVSMQSQ